MIYEEYGSTTGLENSGKSLPLSFKNVYYWDQ